MIDWSISAEFFELISHGICIGTLGFRSRNVLKKEHLFEKDEIGQMNVNLATQRIKPH